MASRSPEATLAALADLPLTDLEFHLADWQVLARDDQLPPDFTEAGLPWRTWLLLGGRGAGKTRAGAEWIRAQALGLAPLALEPVGRIALVGETIHDVRAVMVEGVSGLLAIHAPSERPRFDGNRNMLVWPNGAIAQLFSADDPDSLRGPQFGAAWADELGKWRRAEMAWDMLQLALRLGEAPRVVVTTTPRAQQLLRRLLEDPSTAVSRSKTMDNAMNLSRAFLAYVQARYAGTPLGRQELEGELIDAVPDALWRWDWIDRPRRSKAPDLYRIVVAVDPPVTSTMRSDACGIVVAGIGPDKRAYVVADRTLKARSPSEWVRAAVAAYRDFGADRIVAEVNQGGDLVTTVIRQIAPEVPVRQVRATRGKWLRAEPVAALYAEGRVVHVGFHAELEKEMLGFGADGLSGRHSPDRVDALVWALTDLLLQPSTEPLIRAL